MTNANPFLTDLLAQPAALRDAVAHYDPAVLAGLDVSRFDRIVVTAMGGSHFAGVPAWLSLVSAGLPVWHIDASVLLHDAISLVNERTLLWVVSQSGRSAEIVALLDRVKPAQVLALTNDPASPLAARAGLVQLMHAGVEAVVSTKTYLNSLALTQLMALQMAGRPTDAARDELLAAADAVQAYLADFDARQRSLGARVGVPERLFLLGRGASMAAVDAGALVLKEAAKINAAGMSGPQFRHGPYEMADERVTALILEGVGTNAALQRKLAADLRGIGATALLVGSGSDADLPHPPASGAGLPIVEILPFQLLTFPICAATGFVAGQFRHSTKVTTAL
jgi:glucosamine--fructose-6-phosphate aminotransferase (isomerizing)